jgi:hypothetical protein
MPDIAALIWQAAGLPAIDALANAADLDPVVAVIAVLAKAAGKTSWSADRPPAISCARPVPVRSPAPWKSWAAVAVADVVTAAAP